MCGNLVQLIITILILVDAIGHNAEFLEVLPKKKATSKGRLGWSSRIGNAGAGVGHFEAFIPSWVQLWVQLCLCVNHGCVGIAVLISLGWNCDRVCITAVY